MNKVRLLLTLFIGAALFLIWSGNTFAAAFTKEDDIKKHEKLTLDIIGAYRDGLAEDKKLREAVEGVLQDEIMSWLMDSIGESFGKSEADEFDKMLDKNPYLLTNIKKKYDDFMKTTKLVDQVSKSLANGEYVEALFQAADGSVKGLKFPVLQALWETIKVTYQSHKLVVATGAERDLAAIYGKVESDRKIFGIITPRSDQPPQIPENLETADYFFNRYLMTDDGTRNNFKQYVKNVIGDDWPEQDWNQWIQGYMALGSGQDTVKNAEIEKLDTTLRARARVWIHILIKDINKQARVRWGQVRVAQQIADFEKFNDRVGQFYNNDLAQVFKAYEARQGLKKDMPKYMDYPSNSKAARGRIDLQMGKMKPKDIKIAEGLRNEIQTWRSQGVDFARRAEALGKMDLESAIYEEIRAWDMLGDRIEAFAKNNTNAFLQVIKEMNTEDANAEKGKDNPRDAAIAAIAAHYVDLHQVHLKPFDWHSVELPLPNGRTKSFTPEEAMTSVLSSLNEGDFDTAGDIMGGWNGAVSAAMTLNRKRRAAELEKAIAKPTEDIAIALKDYMTAREAIAAQNRAIIENQKNPLGEKLKEAYRVQEGIWNNAEYNGKWKELGAQYEAAKQHSESIVREIRALDHHMEQLSSSVKPHWEKYGNTGAGWGAACAMLRESLDILNASENTQHASVLADMKDAYAAFSELRQTLAARWARYNHDMQEIKALLPMAPEKAASGWKPDVVAETDRLENFVKERSYTFVKGVKGSGLLFTLPEDVRRTSLDIQEGSIGADAFNVLIIKSEAATKSWDRAQDKLKNLQELNYPSLQQIRILVDKSVNPSEVLKSLEALKATAGKVDGYKKAVSSERFDRMILAANTDAGNREKDAFWLSQKSKELNVFFKEQITKKTIRMGKNDYELNLQVSDDGMVRVEKPYPHYLTKTELKEMTERIRNEWQAVPVFSFIQKYASDHYQRMEGMLLLPGVKAAKEENYLKYPKSVLIWKSSLEGAEIMMKNLVPEDKDYAKKIADVERLLPGIVLPAPEKVVGYVMEDNGGVIHSLEHPMGRQYEKIYKMVSASLDRRLDYLLKERSVGQQEMMEAEKKRTQEEARKKTEQDGMMAQEQAKTQKTNQVHEDRVKAFYALFKEAYEERNDSQIISMLSDKWQANDGSTLSDLQMNLRRTFKMFDEVKYNIQNLSMQLVGSGNGYSNYLVSYDVTITSRIYKRNMKHEEKSSINEEVTIEGSGNPKISKTLGGRFWYVH